MVINLTMHTYCLTWRHYCLWIHKQVQLSVIGGAHRMLLTILETWCTVLIVTHMVLGHICLLLSSGHQCSLLRDWEVMQSDFSPRLKYSISHWETIKLKFKLFHYFERLETSNYHETFSYTGKNLSVCHRSLFNSLEE